MKENLPEPAKEPLPFSCAVPVATVSAAGCSGEIVLDDVQRKALARLLDVLSVERFAFEYTLSSIGRDRFRLTGSLKVSVLQECVVTLETIENNIEDEIDLELWPEKDVAVAEKLANEDGRSIIIDGPEPIDGDTIDIAQIAYEHLSSMIDPYPRKKDAEFQWSTDTAETDKPFAKLGELMRKKSE